MTKYLILNIVSKRFRKIALIQIVDSGSVVYGHDNLI